MYGLDWKDLFVPIAPKLLFYIKKIRKSKSPLLFLFLFTLVLIHSFGRGHAERGGLIHTDITVTHQVEGQIVLSRSGHNIFQTEL
jgi:hypothetical protein